LDIGEEKMSRHVVEVTRLIRVGPKKIHKNLGGGKLGLYQIRSAKNVVKDKRLLDIISCMASQLAGKKYSSLGEVQKAFKDARQGPCKL
jgi:hypothetical protein